MNPLTKQKHRSFKHSLAPGIICAVLIAPAAPCETGNWTTTVNPYGGMGRYSSSSTRDYYYKLGIHADFQYLDSGGLGLGYSYNEINGQSNQIDITEQTLFAGARAMFYPDALPGQLTVTGDFYFIEDVNSGTTTTTVSGKGKKSMVVISQKDTTDNITVIHPQVAFLNYGKTFFAHLGFAYSAYDFDTDNGKDLNVSQWTPTVGFAWNEKYDWLQTRVYYISLSNGARTDGDTTYASVEFKWSHWFAANTFLGLDKFTTTLLGGERVYAVDSDVKTTYSLAHQQTGAVALEPQWRLSDRSTLSTLAGVDWYEDQLLQDSYIVQYIYLTYSKQF